jgi:hypothetical protein
MAMNLPSVTWRRISGWIVRVILVLFIALEIRIWLDILVIQPEEYERLIGGEAGCGKLESFCSWPAFVLDQVPFTILSILSATALLWRRLPRRELILGALVIVIFAYLGWRYYRIQVEVSMSEYCCQYRAPTRVTMQLELLSPT